MTAQLNIFVTDEEREAIRNAEMYASQAYQWIISDKERFLQVSEVFRALAKEGVHIQQGSIIAECMLRNITLSDETMFRNNRNHYPFLCRHLRAFYPELKPYVHIRKSAGDSLTLRAIPFGYYLRGAQCQNRPITRRDWE